MRAVQVVLVAEAVLVAEGSSGLAVLSEGSSGLAVLPRAALS